MCTKYFLPIFLPFFACGASKPASELTLHVELLDLSPRQKNGSSVLLYQLPTLTEDERQFFKYDPVLVTNVFYAIVPPSLLENTLPSQFTITLVDDSNRQLVLELLFTKE